MFIKNRDPEVIRAQEEELRSTAILDNFIIQIQTQIQRHKPFASNIETVEKLLTTYVRGIQAMKRLIDSETREKYEKKATELRELWENRKKEVKIMEEF